jgi:hypothetical protein
MTRRRTVATCWGAAASMTVRPAGVMVTRTPRPSSAHSSLATRPRLHILAIWCDRRLCSQSISLARSYQ